MSETENGHKTPYAHGYADGSKLNKSRNTYWHTADRIEYDRGYAAGVEAILERRK